MNVTPKLVSLGAIFLGCALTSLPAAPIRALFFSKSSGYEHSAIKRVNGAPSYAENIFSKIGPENDIEFTFSKDGSKFSPEYLTGFDVFVFYTSGDLLSVGTDGQPAMTPEGKQALLDAVSGGKGFLAIHSGTDTFHTNEHGGGNNPIRGPRFQNYGEEADPYIKMLGGEFIIHGPQQVATAHVVAPDFPGFGKIGAEVKVKEEWYSTKEFAANDRVLLVLDTKGMEGSPYDRPSYPIAWAHEFGKGRAAGNAMGHREDVWDNPVFQSMIIGQIKWAAGVAKADLTPNLEQVAPGHATLPKAPIEKAK
jgi:type 1 glutamine amidotransferase